MIVRMREIIFIKIKRMVIMWIISRPRKRKSKRKMERKTGRYERRVKNGFCLRMGMV